MSFLGNNVCCTNVSSVNCCLTNCSTVNACAQNIICTNYTHNHTGNQFLVNQKVSGTNDNLIQFTNVSNNYFYCGQFGHQHSPNFDTGSGGLYLANNGSLVLCVNSTLMQWIDSSNCHINVPLTLSNCGLTLTSGSPQNTTISAGYYGQNQLVSSLPGTDTHRWTFNLRGHDTMYTQSDYNGVIFNGFNGTVLVNGTLNSSYINIQDSTGTSYPIATQSWVNTALTNTPTITNPTINGNITLTNPNIPVATQIGFQIFSVNNSVDTQSIPTSWGSLLPLGVNYSGTYLLFFSMKFGYSTNVFLQYAISTNSTGIDDNHHYNTFGSNNNMSGYQQVLAMRIMNLSAYQYVYAIARCTAGSATLATSGDTSTNLGGSFFTALRIA